MDRDNDIEVARLLVDYGASPFRGGFDGSQPLRDIYGEANQKKYEVRKLLLRCIDIEKYMTGDDNSFLSEVPILFQRVAHGLDKYWEMR